ncbi:MAG: hypothetical protein CSA33_01580 [Desulfobulbus propionicus]|nr:MAG: hypothetical protein CSA33_01580 [Desulfobulbus propionicus]
MRPQKILFLHTRTFPTPVFLSTQTIPGSVAFGNAVYLGIWVAKRLPKMITDGRLFGAYFLKCKTAHRNHIYLFLNDFFLNETK